MSQGPRGRPNDAAGTDAREEAVIRPFNPMGVAGPFASYSHGVEVIGSGRFLFGAGQVGVDTDGRIGQGIEEQARLAWRNVVAVLSGGQMQIANIVQLNTLMVSRDDYPTARAVRDEVLGGHRPASTLMYVAGLANPAWLIEIDFVAWASD
jgi:2-iminobutanoate/2-iminopropanoate deaminase